MAKRSLLADITEAYHSELDDAQQSALISWLAFTATFSGVRGITHAIKDGKGPFGNLSMGGEHLHHYMWGIGMLAGVGAIAVRGTEGLRRHPGTALAYGAGLALVVDEFALLLDLKDVYWAKEGRVSVDVAVGGSSLAGSYFAAQPLIRKVLRRRVRALPDAIAGNSRQWRVLHAICAQNPPLAGSGDRLRHSPAPAAPSAKAARGRTCRRRPRGG
jgi:hypothetical protein